MGVFEFVIVLVLISTVGKVLSGRTSRHELKQQAPKPVGSAEADMLREMMDELNGRLTLLEEERDFYKDLLEAPDPRRGLRAPGSSDQGGGETDLI